jgi:hypothetical protein
MVASRRKPPFWRRAEPASAHDIAKLKPQALGAGKRFETLSDTRKESHRRETVLASYRPGNGYVTYLRECRDGDYHCERTYCPICARTFRRYATGELLRLNEETGSAVHVLVVLLASKPNGKLLELDIEPYRHLLRKRLSRAGLGKVPVIGGFEVVYRARSKEWVLHINLVMFGGNKKAIARFEEGFRDDDLYRPVQWTIVKDPVEQLSYILKFTTYHRPHEQRGAKKAKAVPLNPREHFELVRWMVQFEFTDHLLLFNARRRGVSIELSNKVLRKA